MVNVVNSTAHMSSGAGLLNKELQVFAISVGAFYDLPGDKDKAGNPPPAPWTKLNDNNPFTKSVQLPENQDNIVRGKNINVALSVHHSGFRAMLNAIAP